MSVRVSDVPGRWGAWAPRLVGLLRLATALVLIQHGTQKYFSFPSAPPWGPVKLGTMFGVAGLLELIGGGLLLFGLFTRPTAFVLSGMMAVAYFTVHFPKGFYPIDTGGDLAVVYCFCFLYLSAVDPGPWSLDALVRRRSGPAAVAV